MAKETNIDSMKYRKSTHLAGIDVETIIAEKGKCLLTIKEAFYETNVSVSGNKTNGYFLTFVEDIKPMIVNSTNRKIINNIVKNVKNLDNTASRNIGNWAGIKIELAFDPTIKMMGQIVGGIVIVPFVHVEVPDTEALAKLNACTTKAQLAEAWAALTDEEKKLSTVLSLKETLKTKLP